MAPKKKVNIKQIQEWFQSKETLPLVEKHCLPIFEAIDLIVAKMKSNKLTTAELVDKYLHRLGGHFGELNPIAGVADATVKNEYALYYGSVKEEAEREGTRFVDASTKIESDKYVAEFRSIRNLVQYYTQVCEKNIGILQSSLKYKGEALSLER